MSRPITNGPFAASEITLGRQQRRIIELLCQGLSNKEIAFELHITYSTIRHYMNLLFKKVGVRSRTELAIWAIRKGGF